jgi:hypothetical protein
MVPSPNQSTAPSCPSRRTTIVPLRTMYRIENSVAQLTVVAASTVIVG